MRSVRAATRSRGRNWSEIPSAVHRVRPTKLLTPAEELQLVTDLAKLRTKVRDWITPLLSKAPENTRLDHFDQIVTFYQTLKKTRSGPFRKIDSNLVEYNLIRDKLVLANLPWVTKLARGQKHPTLSEDDLFQEGVCGLLKAIDRFEVERGLRLMTYATWYIREAMQQIRARQSHLVALSAHDQTLLGQMEEQKTAFQHQHERAPNIREISSNFNRPLSSLNRLQAATAPAVSLDHGSSDGTIPIPVQDPIDEYDHYDEVQTAVTRLLEALPSRERWVVTQRFGLDGTEPKQLEELGDDLHVSKERIRQLQRQAIRRMQQTAKDENLELLTI